MKPRRSDIKIKRVCQYEGECPYCDFFVAGDTRADVNEEIWKHIQDEECYLEED